MRQGSEVNLLTGCRCRFREHTYIYKHADFRFPCRVRTLKVTSMFTQAESLLSNDVPAVMDENVKMFLKNKDPNQRAVY